MAENPLSGDELFELGKALTSEIHAAVESGRAYYLGLSPHEPPLLLSKVFNPESGPIILYLVKVDRILNDIAKAFEARERQLRGENAAPTQEFFSNQLEMIRRKIEMRENPPSPIISRLDFAPNPTSWETAGKPPGRIASKARQVLFNASVSHRQTLGKSRQGSRYVTARVSVCHGKGLGKSRQRSR